MQLKLKNSTLDLSKPLVMGVLNVTPDSFSDGGQFLSIDAAVARAREMVGEGAAIIDVGGESTRPGAQPVSEQEEIARVVPVIERLSRELDCVISIDTLKPAVMAAACAAGATMINDVNALQAPGALEIAQRFEAAVCLMHMQGEPRSMQNAPQYGDVVTEVRDFLAARVRACKEAGIPAQRILLDPGIGFGKTLEHNLELLANLDAFAGLHCPLLIGVSRKSMFKALLGASVDQRLNGALSAAAIAVWQGAVIVRAHDVRATAEALQVAAALRDKRRAQQ
ncbi:MAG: dihydropteroate synthase [Pseudomonadota bacterium]